MRPRQVLNGRSAEPPSIKVDNSVAGNDPTFPEIGTEVFNLSEQDLADAWREARL